MFRKSSDKFLSDDEFTRKILNVTKVNLPHHNRAEHMLFHNYRLTLFLNLRKKWVKKSYNV